MEYYKNIVVLTGAGISAESGIATFRASDGLWENHKVVDVASPEGYARDPALVQHFYNERRAQLLSPKIKPNAAHHALAKFEEDFTGEFTLITQNIDDLHERAGSKHILHMHGELLKARCPFSDEIIEWKKDLNQEDSCNCCETKQPLRPHIVWFGEMPWYMDKIYNALQKADLFVSIGTSGVVYPAAGFVQEAKHHGAKTVELNLEPSEVQSIFDQKIYGAATKIVKPFFDDLLI